jgi:hypothetical protein
MNEVIGAAVADNDAAWAAINTPLSVEELMVFCQDVGRLFRINPMLEFEAWENLSADSYRMSAKNISHKDQPFEIDVKIKVEKQADEIIFHYSNGIKNKTVMKIEPSEYGSKLTITDHYQDLSEEEAQLHINEVDKSLINWANYLQRFFITWKKWSKFALWRWYMKRIWQPMKPSGRRVTYMLLWITLIEITLITLGAGIYLSEFS